MKFSFSFEILGIENTAERFRCYRNTYRIFTFYRGAVMVYKDEIYCLNHNRSAVKGPLIIGFLQYHMPSGQL